MATTTIDKLIGERMRTRRTLLGISQTAVAEGLGLTFQQVQKYEKGSNRLSCSMMIKLCSVLDVQPSYFVDDLPRDGKPLKAAKADTPMLRRETMELVKVYYKIPRKMRDASRAFLSALAA